MRLKFATIFAAALLLSACASQPKTTADTTGGGMTSTDTQMATETTEPAETTEIGVVPGTQEDLVVNVGDRVFFDFDKYDLRPEAREQLERQAAWLKANPNVTVTVEGHADERGTREYNLALGERRADSARNYLVALGIDPNRIQTISYGKERPAVLGSNEAAWAQNRRGVTVVN
jgi:peptidoglycan-associated lipoprotein